MEAKPEIGHARREVFKKPFRVVLALEADNRVVRIAHDNHLARRLTSPPLTNPEIVDVVQVDIREQRRNHALNAKDNFRFERTIIGWRGWGVLDLRHKT